MNLDRISSEGLPRSGRTVGFSVDSSGGILVMNTQHAGTRFWTTFVEDRKGGSAGLRLHRESSGRATVAAEVIFWDAAGQFYVQTFNGEVPLAIMEALIAETKETIKIE